GSRTMVPAAKQVMLAVGLAMCAAAAQAQPPPQQPRAVNAQVVRRQATADLQQAITAAIKAQSQSAWFGYLVPAMNRANDSRSDGWSDRCRLEQRTSENTNQPASAGPIR